jgi:galactokinase
MCGASRAQRHTPVVASFWAPGRVNLIGEYTDLVGGLVLPVALDLGIRVDAVAADEIVLHSAGFGETRLAADGSGAAEGWSRYVAAVAHELALLGRPPVGIAGELTSTLVAGSGLSSSAALEVAVAIALCAVADFELEPFDLARAAQRAEHRAVGVPSGIMDQAASLLGRAGCALLLDTGTLAYEYIPLPAGLALVIVHSGVTRTLDRSRYAERKRELKEGHPQRVRHVRTENERVRAVVQALRHDDRPELGRLFRAGHESLRVDLEVTIPELDRLVDLAYAHGAVAARMTGGGFGGAIVALVEKAQAQAFAASFSADDEGDRRAFVAAASAGARELLASTV